MLRRSSKTTVEHVLRGKTVLPMWSAVLRMLSVENPIPRRNQGLKPTQNDAIFKQFCMKMILK
jgi:hypothetical protein